MVDIEIRNAGSTMYMVVDNEIVDFTTNADEIENMVDEFIDENNIDSLDVNVNYL